MMFSGAVLVRSLAVQAALAPERGALRHIGGDAMRWTRHWAERDARHLEGDELNVKQTARGREQPCSVRQKATVSIRIRSNPL